MFGVKIKVKILFALLIVFPVFSDGNERVKGVKQFDKQMYGAASQNWSVSAAGNGMIYFANHQGLLEFDGTTWQLYELPNQTILRSVKVLSDTLIFSSGYMEMGLWKPDEYGKLQYHSLNPKARQYFINNIEFWNIVHSEGTVYFQSFSDILAYRNDSVFPVDVSGSVSILSNINGKILACIRNRGIYELSDGKAGPFVTGDFFEGKLIRFLLPYKNDELLVGTASDGLFVWDGAEFRTWKPEWQEYFIENELNRGFYTEKGELVLGTIIDGIVVFDADENLVKKVNTENGLANNTVLGIESDNRGNIWLALDDGISFVPGHTDNSFIIEEIPGVGAIYSTAIFNGKLYLGTNQGLFVETEGGDYELVHGTQGQVWDCKVIDNRLWVNHNRGTFAIENGEAKLICEISGGVSISRDQVSDRLIQSTYTNLIAFRENEDGKLEAGIIDGFLDLTRYVETDHLGNIWASHMYLGVFKIETDDERSRVTQSTYYGENVFGQDHSVHVFKVENRIVFTTNKLIYTYDDLNDTIVPYDVLNEQLGKYVRSHRIVAAPDHHYWFISKSDIGLFRFNEDTLSLVKEFPTSLFVSPPLVDRFENILPLTDNTAILSLQNGIARLDASKTDTTFVFDQYQPVIRLLELKTNKGRTLALPVNQTGFKIKNNFNNLRVRISFPFLSELPIYHQYQMEGLGQVWSEKTSNPEFSFERLPFGKYTLRIKSSDTWGNESNTVELGFEVLPPWYLSSLAVIAYILLMILVLFGFRAWGIRQTRKKEQLQHEKREQELIRLRNEKLRNEVRYKSKELANSTMAIIKKNEFLLDLKKIIEKQKAELGSRYPDKYYNYLNEKIESNISNQDDWQVFETNFERAHEQFFSKIKETFPDLTSSDLRLCAYLRMNLSSKEIAPLLGISVRGVENHRYRLRKKMNLSHEDSLTDTIHAI